MCDTALFAPLVQGITLGALAVTGRGVFGGHQHPLEPRDPLQDALGTNH